MSSYALTGRPMWRVAAAAFASSQQRSRIESLLGYAPVTLVLLVQAIASLRLDNIANADEALYIDAGHAYIDAWMNGSTPPEYGAYFSGHPLAYPVIAAVIDTVGGLSLVRLFSLMMAMGGALCVYAMARSLAGQLRGGLAGCVGMLFAVLSGPVMFVGNLATFDALCMAAIAGATALAMTRGSYTSAVIAGAVIAVAGIMKYTGAAFVPVVAAIALCASGNIARGLMRASLILVTSGLALLAVYLPSAQFISQGIAFTTSNREAHNYRSVELLSAEFGKAAGLLLVLAVVGLIVHVAVTRDLRSFCLGMTLIAAAVALPISQMRIHEYTSFNKHLAFTAIFLAPLAAQIVRMSRPVARAAIILAGVYLMAIAALYRSAFMFGEWPDSTSVIQFVQDEGRPGTYLAVGARTMAYYSKESPELSWEEPWALYGAGRSAMRQAVHEARYAGVMFTTGDQGDARLNANTAYMQSLLSASSDYRMVRTFPKGPNDTLVWQVWLRETGA